MSAGTPKGEKTRRSTATQFFLRGLAIILPPILTLVILIWIATAINKYVVQPTSALVRMSIAQLIDKDIRRTEELQRLQDRPPLDYCETDYRVTQELKERIQRRLAQRQESIGGNDSRNIPVGWLRESPDEVYVPFGGEAVPYGDYAIVAERVPPDEMPQSAMGVYEELGTIRYFGGQFLLSAGAVAVMVVLVYFLGRMVTVRLGAWAITKVEATVVNRLPLISNVYSSVKQVTDFLFTERPIEYNRVVAVEWPRRGMWVVAFATSDSLRQIAGTLGEPLITVLVPTSPMPMTGFTVSLSRREVIDLDLTIDQAFQFCLSCGVLVPPHQKVTPESLREEFARQLADTGRHGGDGNLEGTPSAAGQTQGPGADAGESEPSR